MTELLRLSNAGRWVPCPASPRMEAPFPDVEGEDAKEGTAAHWAAAQVLGGHNLLDELVDRAAPNGVIITGDMLDHIQMYIDEVGPGAVIERELPASIPGVAGGTPDARRIVDGAITKDAQIWDLKYGYGIVEAVDNWQGACYVVGLFTKHNWELDSVTFTIVQPRPFHPDGRARSWVIYSEYAQQLYMQLQEAAQRTQDPNAPCVTGDHCQYCRALHVCEAARRAGLNAIDVSLAGTPVDLPPEALGEELRTLRRAQDMIKLRRDALEADATARIDAGQIVPGWSLDRAFGKRRWTDGVATLEALSGLTLTEAKPVTPAEAERRGADKMLIKQFTTTPETGRKLVERDNSAKAAQVFK